MTDRINLTAIIKFNAKNFHRWKFQIKCALRTMIGETMSIDKNEQLTTWNKRNAIAMFIANNDS